MTPQELLAQSAGTSPETPTAQQADGFTPVDIYERSIECGDDYDFPAATDEEVSEDWWL